MSIENEISEIKRRWLELGGENLKYFQANPQDLSESGRFFAIDIPRLLDIAMHNVEFSGEGKRSLTDSAGT